MILKFNILIYVIIILGVLSFTLYVLISVSRDKKELIIDENDSIKKSSYKCYDSSEVDSNHRTIFFLPPKENQDDLIKSDAVTPPHKKNIILENVEDSQSILTISLIQPVNLIKESECHPKDKLLKLEILFDISKLNENDVFMMKKEYSLFLDVERKYIRNLLIAIKLFIELNKKKSEKSFNKLEEDIEQVNENQERVIEKKHILKNKVTRLEILFDISKLNENDVFMMKKEYSLFLDVERKYIRNLLIAIKLFIELNKKKSEKSFNKLEEDIEQVNENQERVIEKKHTPVDKLLNFKLKLKFSGLNKNGIQKMKEEKFLFVSIDKSIIMNFLIPFIKLKTFKSRKQINDEINSYQIDVPKQMNSMERMISKRNISDNQCDLRTDENPKYNRVNIVPASFLKSFNFKRIIIHPIKKNKKQPFYLDEHGIGDKDESNNSLNLFTLKEHGIEDKDESNNSLNLFTLEESGIEDKDESNTSLIPLDLEKSGIRDKDERNHQENPLTLEESGIEDRYESPDDFTNDDSILSLSLIGNYSNSSFNTPERDFVNESFTENNSLTENDFNPGELDYDYSFLDLDMDINDSKYSYSFYIDSSQEDLESQDYFDKKGFFLSRNPIESS